MQVVAKVILLGELVIAQKIQILFYKINLGEGEIRIVPIILTSLTAIVGLTKEL